MKKVIRPGTIKTDGGASVSIFCEIEYTQGKLSITGVIGPRPSGNSYGGAGQINMDFAHRNPEDNDHRTYHPITPEDITFAPGWDREKWLDLLDVWGRWHLNDLKAGCVHQRAMGWGKKKVTIAHLKLSRNKIHLWSEIKRKAEKELYSSGKAELTPEELEIMNMPYSLTVPIETVDNYPDYSTENTEEKLTTWIKESEHPEGVLSKPCPVCGYKYGSAWLREEVPAEVIDFLNSLPDADRQPAWV
jgi:hypothetical protein